MNWIINNLSCLFRCLNKRNRYEDHIDDIEHENEVDSLIIHPYDNDIEFIKHQTIPNEMFNELDDHLVSHSAWCE